MSQRHVRSDPPRLRFLAIIRAHGAKRTRELVRMGAGVELTLARHCSANGQRPASHYWMPIALYKAQAERVTALVRPEALELIPVTDRDTAAELAAQGLVPLES